MVFEKDQRLASAWKSLKTSLTEFSAVWAYNPISGGRADAAKTPDGGSSARRMGNQKLPWSPQGD
jgi:hypothetical protein